MRVGLVSDLHFEFHRDGGGGLVAELARDCDVLVAAGDIAVGEGIRDALRLLCGAFERVVYLPGNHEYYGTTRQHVIGLVDAACRRHENLSWLRPGASVIIGGQRFLGGTLWFPEHPTAPKHALNDFNLIRDFETWVYEENRETVAFLEGEVRSDDIVVTHHLPSPASTPDAFRDSPLNPFFVCDLEHLIRANQPKLWLHGHTHTSCDYLAGKTRVVCNPFGYPRALNARFDPAKILEVP
jgi:Icc-related predicted phosphoesterase